MFFKFTIKSFKKRTLQENNGSFNILFSDLVGAIMMQCINILSNHCSIDMEEKETTNLTSPILFLGVKELPPQGCELGSLGAVNSCLTRYAMTPHISRAV